MKTFLGMEVKKDSKTVKLHLDHYVHEMLAEYKDCIKKSLRPKRVSISPGVILCLDDFPEVPDPLKQKCNWSFVAKLEFAASWISFNKHLWYCSLRGFVLRLPQVQPTP